MPLISRRSRKNSLRDECVVMDAVVYEPVSKCVSLLSREKQRNTAENGEFCGIAVQKGENFHDDTGRFPRKHNSEIFISKQRTDSKGSANAGKAERQSSR